MVKELLDKPDYLPGAAWDSYLRYKDIQIMCSKMNALIQDKYIWRELNKEFKRTRHTPEDQTRVYSLIISVLIRMFAVLHNDAELSTNKEMIDRLKRLKKINDQYARELSQFYAKESEEVRLYDDLNGFGWGFIAWDCDYPDIPRDIPSLSTLLDRISNHYENEIDTLEKKEPANKGKSRKQPYHILARKLSSLFYYVFQRKLRATTVRCINAFFGDVYTCKDFDQVIKNTDLAALAVDEWGYIFDETF